MSSYCTRYCSEHGEWDDDIDHPSDCPDCEREGKTYTARLEAQRDALKARVSKLEIEIRELRQQLDLLHQQLAEATACDVCDGSGRTMSATPCGCKGNGVWGLVDSLRESLFDAEQRQRDDDKTEAKAIAGLPSLSSLRGMAPEMTNGLSSVDFVRNLRDSGSGRRGRL